MRLPESQITVTAWVKISSASGEQGILTALADPKSPRGYPFERGLELELKDGCLSAKLNTTEITASTPIPLNRWVKAAFVYDGNRMSLYSDGILAAATDSLPTTDDVEGWDQKSLHFGDPSLPYSGDGPVGIMIQKVVGAKATVAGRTLSFNVPVGASVTVLVNITTDRNSKSYLADAFKAVDQANIPLLYQQHLNWWQNFWTKSFIQVSDNQVEQFWYGSLYLYACSSRPGCPPPGLWGNWNEDRDNVGWQGDYTLDYNAEAPPWAAYETNHWELADNYEDPILQYMARGRSIAKHNGYSGLLYYTHLIPGVGWDDDPSQFMGQQSAILFGCVDCAMRWRLTGDLAYAKKVYPLLRGTADFWDHYLTLENGVYVDNGDATDEFNPPAVNPATSIAFLNLLYPTLLQMSEALGQDSALRPVWNKVYTHLSPLPIVKAASIDHVGGYKDNLTLEQILGPDLVGDKLAIRDSLSGTGFPLPCVQYHDDRERSTSAGMNSTQVIYPGWQIGALSTPTDQEAALETVTLASEWYDGNDDCTFYPSAAIAGYDPVQILDHLDTLIKDHASPSFILHAGGGGTEDFAIIPATLSQMFQQSFQGTIHIFPNWPKTENASFGNIPACGGFLLASSEQSGNVQYVQITSTEGSPVTMINPMGGSQGKGVCRKAKDTHR